MAAMNSTFSHHARLPILGLGLSETRPRYSPARHARPRSVSDTPHTVTPLPARGPCSGTYTRWPLRTSASMTPVATLSPDAKPKARLHTPFGWFVRKASAATRNSTALTPQRTKAERGVCGRAMSRRLTPASRSRAGQTDPGRAPNAARLPRGYDATCPAPFHTSLPGLFQVGGVERPQSREHQVEARAPQRFSCINSYESSRTCAQAVAAAATAGSGCTWPRSARRPTSDRTAGSRVDHVAQGPGGQLQPRAELPGVMDAG